MKKLILKKRDALEKDLQNEIQKELSTDMAIHIKNICAKQESVTEKKEPSKYMKKKWATRNNPHSWLSHSYQIN